MNTEPGEREEAPERIYMHPTSAEANVNPWPLEPGEYVEYIRADLAATRMRERCVAELNALLLEYEKEQQSLRATDGASAAYMNRAAILTTQRAIARIESLDGEKKQ